MEPSRLFSDHMIPTSFFGPCTGPALRCHYWTKLALLSTQPRSALTMEAFQLLSRGGVKFDKSKFKSDVDLFQVSILPRKHDAQLEGSFCRRKRENPASPRATWRLLFPARLSRRNLISSSMPKAAKGKERPLRSMRKASRRECEWMENSLRRIWMRTKVKERVQ